MISQILFNSSLVFTPGAMVLVQAIVSTRLSTMTLTSEQPSCLSPSVHPVWSCQADLPKSQLESCHSLAQKSYDHPRSTQKDPGSSRDFGGLFCRLLFAWQVEARVE